MANAEKVAFKAFLDAVLCLANILVGTFFAFNAINKVIAIAGDVVFAGVGFTSGCAFDMAGMV